MPCALEWLRFVVVYLFAGPTGGRQSALQVTWTFSFRTSYVESIRLLFNSCEEGGLSNNIEEQSLPFCAPSPWFSGSPALCSLSSFRVLRVLPVGGVSKKRAERPPGDSTLARVLRPKSDRTHSSQFPGVHSDQDHLLLELEVTRITIPPLSLTSVDETDDGLIGVFESGR